MGHQRRNQNRETHSSLPLGADNSPKGCGVQQFTSGSGNSQINSSSSSTFLPTSTSFSKYSESVRYLSRQAPNACESGLGTIGRMDRASFCWILLNCCEVRRFRFSSFLCLCFSSFIALAICFLCVVIVLVCFSLKEKLRLPLIPRSSIL